MTLRRRQLRSSPDEIALIARGIEDPVERLKFLKTAMPETPAANRLRVYWIASSALMLVMLIPFWVRRAVGSPEAPKAHVVRPKPSPTPKSKSIQTAPVWLVETSKEAEVYSNGLRIDTRFAITNHPRHFLAFRREAARAGSPVSQVQPIGIVYHTTESRQAPFEAEDNRELRRLGESLLEYVRRERAYHYLIDRFGRVYRVVAESDAANHAGHSVWADHQWLYLNLNDSFLGVSFEARSHTSDAGEVAGPAQIRAAGMLTEMLRGRYQIPAENCVTHAQVSVNPTNMRIGYHTDWASGFPFEALGLPDNYELAPPSLWAFGFAAEPAFLRSAGNRISPAINLAEQDLLWNAVRSGVAPEVYRKKLQRQYRECLAQARHANS